MDIQAELHACKTSLAAAEVKLNILDGAVRGNGRKGLLTEFELLKSRIAQLEEFKSDMKRTRQWAMATGVAMVGNLAMQALSSWAH